MREAGKMLAEVHNMVADYLKPGISTYEIDQYALKIIKKFNATPSFYHLYDFPGNFCISINDELIHGIPSKDVIIKDGDVLKIDGGVCYNGYHSDAARTYIIGNANDDIKKFVEATKQSFFEAIKGAVPNNHIVDIAKQIEKYIKPLGYGIVEDYVGHGIGSEVHEDPEIPNFVLESRGPKIRENMTLAIEPMLIMSGNIEVETLDNEWTVVSSDGSITAHYENTILVTENGPEILSLI